MPVRGSTCATRDVIGSSTGASILAELLAELQSTGEVRDRERIVNSGHERRPGGTVSTMELIWRTATPSAHDHRLSIQACEQIIGMGTLDGRA